MRRALGLVVLVFLFAGARVAFAEGYTATAATDPLWGLAPLDDTALAKISGRGVAHPRTAEPSRVILWDEEPPKSTRSAHHAHAARPSPSTRAVTAPPTI